jgi:hypothetical protein
VEMYIHCLVIYLVYLLSIPIKRKVITKLMIYDSYDLHFAGIDTIFSNLQMSTCSEFLIFIVLVTFLLL